MEERETVVVSLHLRVVPARRQVRPGQRREPDRLPGVRDLAREERADERLRRDVGRVVHDEPPGAEHRVEPGPNASAIPTPGRTRGGSESSRAGRNSVGGSRCASSSSATVMDSSSLTVATARARRRCGPQADERGASVSSTPCTTGLPPSRGPRRHPEDGDGGDVVVAPTHCSASLSASEPEEGEDGPRTGPPAVRGDGDVR